MDEAAVRRIDRSGLLDHVRSLPDQLAKGLALAASLGPVAANRHATVVGMGGSAAAGEVLGAWLAAERAVPLAVVRDSRLPGWVGEGDLLLAVSYSGNTLETLSATNEALSRGCDVVGITSGGTLRDLCLGRGLPLVPMPTGFAPRAAFGYVFGGLAGLFDVDGVGAGVRDAADVARERRSRLEPSVPVSRNPAKRLASRVKGRTPIVYATSTYAPVARRWQTQFNENAKVLAWASGLPEADHNEIVGWSGDAAAKRFAPIFLLDPEDAADHVAVLDATRDLVRRKAKVDVVRAEGPSLLARMLTTVQLGDWTSLYLAVLRRVDPTPVAAIGKLKARLAKKG